MRTSRLALPLLLLLPTFLSAQQIANGGFEDWSDVFAYQDISDWRTGNWELPMALTTTQVPGVNGMYAAHLETQITANDTAFGYLLHGEIEDFPTGGIPFSTAVDAVEGWYRYDLQPGDSALIVVGIWSGGALVSFDVHKVGGTNLTWSSFSLPVNGGVPVTPDSVVVGMASSDAFDQANVVDGSWIEFDDVRLTSSIVTTPDELPNFDMEDWYDVSTEEADGWSSFNPFLAHLGLAPVTKSLMASSGNYSVRIETLALNNDSVPGIITNGQLSINGTNGGVPYAAMPATMEGWFQYQPSGTDTARIYAVFTSGGGPVGSAYQQITSTTATWTYFSTPVTMLIPPDQVLINVLSGSNSGSVLYLDDLDFTGGTVGVTEVDPASPLLFPNPAGDELNVLTGAPAASDVRVLDASGRLVQRTPMTASEGILHLSVSALAPGSYWLELSSGNGTRRLPFVKQ